MKAILSLLILVAVVFSQGAPAAMSAQAAEWRLVKILTGATSDSVLPGDSMIIIPTQGFARGYEYILKRGPITGTVADSAGYQLNIDSYDPSGAAIIQRMVFDTIGWGVAAVGVNNVGESIMLPIGKTIIGSTFRVRVKVLTSTTFANSTTAKRFFPYMSLWSRKLATN